MGNKTGYIFCVQPKQIAGWPLIPQSHSHTFFKLVIPAILKALLKPISATNWYNVCGIVSLSFPEFMYPTNNGSIYPKF